MKLFKPLSFGKKFKSLRQQEALRIYNSIKWRIVRKQKLVSNPLCENPYDLPNHIEPSQEVHHKVRIQDDPSKAYDSANLQSLCRSCHHRIHNNK